MSATKKFRSDYVTKNIPEGTVASGLQNSMQGRQLYGDDLEEVQAYFLTHEGFGDLESRMKQFGMFLRDRGVPWEHVDGITREYIRTNKMTKELKDRVYTYMKERGLVLR